MRVLSQRGRNIEVRSSFHRRELLGGDLAELLDFRLIVELEATEG